MMKNLTLTLMLLVSVCSIAQKSKTIVDPYYEFKKSGITNISRIEQTPESTRVYIHSVFMPNWWVMFSKDEVIIDSKTKKEYKVTGIEGAEFNKKLWMPSSGDSTIVLIFPPLPKNTKKIDYNDDVFGVSLDEALSGMKPNCSVPEEINEWMEKELAKSTKEPLDSLEGEEFFSEENARIVGYIKGYSPLSGIQSGVVYLSNYITREDFPMVVEIQKDGRFEVTLPLIAPIYSNISYERLNVPFYIEPGHTLGMILDWNDALEASRLRDGRTYSWDIAYKGKLANVNNDLQRFRFEGVSSWKFRKNQMSMSQDDKVRYYTNQKDMELSRIEFYNQNWNVSKKAYSILKNKVLLKYGEELLSIDMHRKHEARRNKDNAELQKPLPDSFFVFLSDIPVEKQSLLVNDEFKWFVNRYEYSSVVDRQRQKAVEKVGLVNSFLDYLALHKDQLDAEDVEIVEFMAGTFNSMPPNTRKKEDADKLNGYVEKYNVQFKNWEKERKANIKKIEVERWNLANEFCEEKYGLMDNLTLDIAKIRSLKFQFEHSDKEEAKYLWGDLKKDIDHKFLIATGDTMFRRAYNEKANLAYGLPEGKATDIFNKIIEPHKGKILFVDFWATSCGPCVSGIKRMKDTRKEFEGNQDIDFVFITDDRSSPAKKYDDFVKEQDLKNTYRISKSDYLYLRQLFRFYGIPRYVVIGRDGKVIDGNFRMYNFNNQVDSIIDNYGKPISQRNE